MIQAQAVTEVVTHSRGFVFLFVPFLVLPLLVFLAVLAINRKTRPITLGVVGVLGLIGGLLLLFMIMGFSSSRTIHQRAQVHDYPTYHRGPSQRVAQQTKSVGVSQELIRAYEAVAESYADSPNVIEVDTSSDAATTTEVEESTEPLAGDAAVGDETEAEDSAEQPSEDSATHDDGETDRPEAIGEEELTPPAKPKPDWVTSPPKRIRGSFQRVIESGPFTTVDECDRRLNELMTMATAEYMDDLYGTDEFAREFNSPIMNLSENNPPHRVVRARLSRLSITPGYIRDHICKDNYVDTVQRSVGPMKQVYVLMEFDEEVKNNLHRRWKDRQLEGRLAVVGVGSSAVLLLLGTVFGFFKLDTATKGYYTKRLIFGALLVTMAGGFFALLTLDEFTRYF